ncbi:YihY/virulence factor BrkB family protein [Microbacterium sp. SS28]|uniref:YihY/virulence factor BrkB family protein n=1 Tax=Microbacterium sp. SS28 TaxID=2919948 RepID=UPI001FAA1FD8|nr:YihY/virulence factor BrkB family protein [Microbacterium sp. SS28]
MAETAASAPRRGNIIDRVMAWALTLKPARVWFHYVERRGFMLADSITYRALFSVFAGVLLGFSFATLWLSDNPQAMQALIDAVDAAIPGLVGENGIVDVSEISAPAGFTVAGIASLVALFGGAIGAIGSTRAAMRTLAGELHDDRFWVWVIARNVILAIVIGAGFLVSAGATFFGTALIERLRDWIGLQSGIVADLAIWVLALGVVFILDASLIALLFVSLSGVKARPRTLIAGALLGGVGLTVLQQLSGLFVRGASANPLLASFASLIALLIWFNLASQVVLIASTWILIGVAEDTDRVRARFGATTFALRRVRKAEDAVRVATAELEKARAEEEKERERLNRTEDKRSENA